jgi:hypothetical protein
MVRNVWLGEPDRISEFTDAGLGAFMSGNQGDEPQPSGVGQRLAGGAIGYGLARTICRRPTFTVITQEDRNELDAAGDRSSRR